RNARATAFAFVAQKTMYGGKRIAKGDMIFLFASENAGGQGLIARGVVTSAEAVARKRDLARQTPRVSITIKRMALAKHRLGRSELKPFTRWNAAAPKRSSISSSTARRQTRSRASRTKRRHSSTASSNQRARTGGTCGA